MRSAVALAPYVLSSDDTTGVTGKRLLIVHGTRDRIADPANAVALARRLAASACVAYVGVEGARHAMLRRHGVFSGLAAAFCTATLLGEHRSAVLARLDAGERWISV